MGSNTGTWFTIVKTGIYAINGWIAGSTNNLYYASIDASTNAAHSTVVPGNTTELASTTGFNGAGRVMVNYTGYLPSNAGMYYKLKVGGGLSANTVYRLYITFLGETPSNSSFIL